MVLEKACSSQKRRKRAQAHHSSLKVHNPGMRSIRTHAEGQRIAPSKNRVALGAELNALDKASRSGGLGRRRHEEDSSSERRRKTKSTKAKKQDELHSSPRGGAYCVATRQLMSQATRGDGLEAEVKQQ